jgi:hypothetical protein
MNFNIEQALEILSQTPATLSSLLGNLSEGWTSSREGAATWSPSDVVRHLVQGEEINWIQRVKVIIAQGEDISFKAYDRFAYIEECKNKSLEELLTKFALLRSENIAAVRQLNITPDKFELVGVHPDLGRVTLQQLIAAWAAHDLNHIAQIVRVMARQYEVSVGPWKAFMAIFRN